MTVRELSAASGASVGSVSGVIADLKVQGFLAARGTSGLTLVDAHRLAEAWAQEKPGAGVTLFFSIPDGR